MKLNNKIIIRISTEHKEILEREASDLGLALGSYCRFKLVTNPVVNLSIKQKK
jgi:hypothetical protein